MLKFSEMFEFSKEKFRKIPILKEFEWFEWFEWFGPSPIEPFNSGAGRRREVREADPAGGPVEDAELARHEDHAEDEVLPALETYVFF